MQKDGGIVLEALIYGGRTMVTSANLHQRSEAVCKITTSTGLASGFVVGPHHILTNRHVLGTRGECETSSAEFYSEHSAKPIKVDFNPSEFFLAGESLDYALVAFTMNPEMARICKHPISFNYPKAERPSQVWIIQHPFGGPKKIALGPNKLIEVSAFELRYDAETARGSSGSPVLTVQDDELRLFGLHYAGGTATYNRGIPIQAIMRDIALSDEYGKIATWMPRFQRTPQDPDDKGDKGNQIVRKVSAVQRLRILKTHTDTSQLQFLCSVSLDLIASGWSYDAIARDRNREDCTIKLWNTHDGNLSQTLTGHTRPVYALCAPSSDLLASGSVDTTVKTWDIATGACALTLKGHTKVVHHVCFPSSDLLASGSSDGTIKLWDIRIGNCSQTLREESTCEGDIINSLCAPSSNLLASGLFGGTIKLWDIRTGTLLRDLTGHKGAVRSLGALSPDLLASGGASDGTVKLWNLRTGVCIKSVRTFGSARVICVPSPNLVFYGGGKVMGLWDIETDTRTRISVGKIGVLSLCTLSPDLVASGGSSGKITLWKILFD